MAYAPERGRARGWFAHTSRLGLLPDASGYAHESPPHRDITKAVLVLGLATLSWVATFIGMLELIEANTGSLPLVHKIVIGFSAAMLMTMIVWLLKQLFSPLNPLTRLSYLGGYLFLTMISVGFGFGFFWKVIESRSESSRSAEIAVGTVQTSLNAATTRLEQLNATLVQLAALSRDKAEQERTHGSSCPNSSPGDGPRRRMRDDDAQRFSFASEFVSGRVSAVKTDMGAMDGDLARIAARDPALVDPKTGTRNEFMRTLGRKLDMTVSSYNALRTDPQLRQMRQDLADRADKTTFGEPGRGGFVCPDPQLSQALRGAARAIAELPALETPAVAVVEGPEATIEAFRRLTTTVSGLFSLKLAPSADELRALQKKAIQSIENGAHAEISTEGGGLSERDYIPLAIAIFVDLCLLLVAMGRPTHRLHGLVPKMREAEQGPVIEILSRFNDIHRDPAVRESFELFRHVVFDVHGAYYVAVPLDAPPHLPPKEREAARIEAQLLANLFTSFEKDRIFRRTWTPFTPMVQKKLARQGSKFAGSEAFRLYKFRDGAWPEIILGAVMGAAHRAEAEADRRRLERDIFRPFEPTFRTVEPAIKPPAPTNRSTPRPAPPTNSSPQPTTKTANASDISPPASSKPWAAARYGYAKTGASASDVFGPYAKSAEAELAAVGIANDDIATPPQARTDTSTRNPKMPPTDERHQASPPDTRVDLILKRETATVTLPLGASQEPQGLIGRLGEALNGLETGPEKKSSPILAPRNTLPIRPETKSITPHREEAQWQDSKSVKSVAENISSDSKTDDTVAIADRWRSTITVK